MEQQLANGSAWNRFFATYGHDVEVYLDPRSGTPSSILAHIPLIPGNGAGNRLTLADMSQTFERNVIVVDDGGQARCTLYGHRPADDLIR